MKDKKAFQEAIFTISSEEFTTLALELFRFQSANNPVYAIFIKELGIDPLRIQTIDQIPFLPVEFFKTHRIVTFPTYSDPVIFRSSGTTGMQFSEHVLFDLPHYLKVSETIFESFYGALENYVVLALLPAYLDRPDSSLVAMADHFIKKAQPGSGFFNKDLKGVVKAIENSQKEGKKVFLLGVTFALLDLAEKFELNLSGHIVMETGGMKGRRKEMIREELHEILTSAFHADAIHSEYGMTELLSQGYSKGNGIFETPRWMKVLLRDANDPLTCSANITSGGVNIIDLANVDSCAFIATQDLGKMYPNGTFEILGRFDYTDMRGCNLLYV